ALNGPALRAEGKLPPLDAQEAAVQPDRNKTYIVRPGDCLWKIAKQIYGTGSRWDVLYEANRTVLFHPDVIYIGQVLAVPAA
ncbi:MAG: LysM peptidoglycan-binding domain-containing protein, partial [Anaerotignum sp.]